MDGVEKLFASSRFQRVRDIFRFSGVKFVTSFIELARLMIKPLRTLPVADPARSYKGSVELKPI